MKNCLDTYALIEIILENPKYSFLVNQHFVITNLTLVELYKTMLKKFGKEIALIWYDKFKPYCEDVDIDLLVKAVDFQYENRREDVSLFDCIGYIFSLENNLTFVTGDKAFKNKNGVLFIQK